MQEPESSRTFCVLGESLKHTMSPPIHKRLFELKDRLFQYSILEIKSEQLDNSRTLLRSLRGYNVTIPHKIGIMRQLDELDETAKRYGAVNCVDNKDGFFTGYNTDVDGFVRSLRAAGQTLACKVLLLGCGGVGRMMAIESVREGAALTIAVREADFPAAQEVRAAALIQKPNAEISLTTLGEISGDFDLLMNATPVGMYPNLNQCVVPDEIIARAGFVFDVIYNPAQTLLMQKAQALGIPTLGGMAMLVWQAVSAHEIWDGDTYTDTEVNEIIREMEEVVTRDFPAAENQ